MILLEVFDRKYLWIWLLKAEAWFSSDGLKFYTDGSLFEGREGAGVFLEELDLKASFALGIVTTVFQAEVYAILACSDCLRVCMTGKTICICSDSRFIGVKFAHSVIKAGATVPKLYARTLYL
jgi:hypothetical protein